MIKESNLKIFSYLPNPRVWKALIAAEFSGAEIEVVGDKPKNLGNWLWDFNAEELPEHARNDDSPHARKGRRGFSGILFKTDDFLKAHPFGTVPAAFSPDGAIGIFESNSILRAAARAGSNKNGLYGEDGFQASRIDSFLDASLVFSREAQVYLLSVESLSQENYARMQAAYEFYLSGIEAALEVGKYLAGDELTIADISFVCDVGQFLRERFFREALEKQDYHPIGGSLSQEFPKSFHHMIHLSERAEFSKHLGNYMDGLTVN